MHLDRVVLKVGVFVAMVISLYAAGVVGVPDTARPSFNRYRRPPHFAQKRNENAVDFAGPRVLTCSYG